MFSANLLWRTNLIAAVCVGLMLGCADSRGSESADSAAITPTVLLPTPAPLPTVAAPAPSLTSTTTPTATPTSSPTPTVTLTPTVTPTPTATPTPTTTPTPTLPPPLPNFACRSRAALSAAQPTWLARSGPWPRPAASAYVFSTGYRGAPPLAHLGFDVEGAPDHLAELLDVLDARQVKTTLFILGSWAQTYPEWVTEFVARGHELANHAYTHRDLTTLDSAEILRELNQTEALVQDLTGQSTRPWLRPPYGALSDLTVNAALDGGWTTISWSGSTEDWRANQDEDRLCRTLLAGLFPGAILYTHTGRPEIPAVVDRFLGEAQARGFTVVPLSIFMSDDPTPWLTSH